MAGRANCDTAGRHKRHAFLKFHERQENKKQNCAAANTNCFKIVSQAIRVKILVYVPMMAALVL